MSVFPFPMVFAAAQGWDVGDLAYEKQVREYTLRVWPEQTDREEWSWIARIRGFCIEEVCHFPGDDEGFIRAVSWCEGAAAVVDWSDP